MTDLQTKPLAPPSVPATPQAELDRALEVLQTHKDEWARLELAETIRVLDEIHAALPAIEERWVAAGMAAKAARPHTLEEGEEQFTLTVIYRTLRFLRQSLVDIQRSGRPRIPGPVKRRPDGRLVARVLPRDWQERLALPRIHAEVWFDADGLDERGLPAQAASYRAPNLPGKVALVLSAGNVASLVPGDFLHKLFVERQVVLLKTNPVNAYLAPLIAEGFAPLIRRGVLQIVHGGAEEGQYLANHPLVDEVHLTGSVRTYEAVVFGPGAEGQARKQAHKPLLEKRFTAELGNVSPVIIVPGPWSPGDLRRQAVKLGDWLVPNAGFNCTTPRMLVNWAGWPQRQSLLEGIARHLEEVPTRKAYYPGAFKAHDRFTAGHPSTQQLGVPQEGQLPWTFIPDLDSGNPEEICFNREAFLGLYAETSLDAADPIAYIKEAVEFANQRLWGTLTASIIVHPKSLKDPRIAAAVDQAIADLHYGTVVVNHWGALSYYAAIAPWGGYRGADAYDIQSGVGTVNNPLMFDQPEKSVLYTPFTLLPDPYKALSKRSYRYFRRDTRYQHSPTLGNFVKVLWAALFS